MVLRFVVYYIGHTGISVYRLSYEKLDRYTEIRLKFETYPQHVFCFVSFLLQVVVKPNFRMRCTRFGTMGLGTTKVVATSQLARTGDVRGRRQVSDAP